MFITDYSIRNVSQIKSQRKNPTDLDGIKGWEHRGYQVKHNEQGIEIWYPVKFNELGEAIRFARTIVYDITQVEPIPGFNAKSPRKPANVSHNTVKSCKLASKSSEITWQDILSGKG